MMPLEDQVTMLQAIIVVITAATVLLWKLPGPCACDKCAFHANERRMAALRQKELEHDYAHKGQGFNVGSADHLACSDASCPRNPKVPVDNDRSTR